MLLYCHLHPTVLACWNRLKPWRESATRLLSLLAHSRFALRLYFYQSFFSRVLVHFRIGQLHVRNCWVYKCKPGPWRWHGDPRGHVRWRGPCERLLLLRRIIFSYIKFVFIRRQKFENHSKFSFFESCFSLGYCNLHQRYSAVQESSCVIERMLVQEDQKLRLQVQKQKTDKLRWRCRFKIWIQITNFVSLLIFNLLI